MKNERQRQSDGRSLFGGVGFGGVRGVGNWLHCHIQASGLCDEK